MQHLNIDLIKTAKKERMQKLEEKMKEVIVVNIEGSVFICPYCKYESEKNPKGSAKVFQKQFFKCFSCGKWRKI